MTLEDAIRRYEGAVKTYESAGWYQSATDARQHVEWLTELRKLRNTRIRQLAEIHGLKDENARLRELLHEMHGAYVDMTKLYEESERDALWEYSTNPVVAARNLESKCEKERHRFDAVMRELGIKESK